MRSTGHSGCRATCDGNTAVTVTVTAAAARAAYSSAFAAATAARAANATTAAIVPDEYLLLSASLCLDVLRELKSPGCAWLDREKEAQ